MTSERFKAMQSTFGPKEETRERGPNRYYPLGKVEIDTSVTLRFLPDLNPDNKAGFLKELITHNLQINGAEKRIPCLEMWGETCPICEQAKQYFNANQNEAGSRIWKKRNYVAQVLIIDDPLKLDVDPSNPIKLLSVGKQVVSIIKEAFVSGELDNEPDAMVGGYNFTIKKTKGGAKADGSGFYPTYSLGTKFANRSSDVPAELRDLITANLIDLEELMPAKPDVANVMADLQAAIGGARSASQPAFKRAASQQIHDIDDDDQPVSTVPVTRAADTSSVQSSTAELLARLKRNAPA